jgi:hypothetical protein
VRVNVDDEGKVSFLYNDAPAPDYLVNKAKREHGHEIKEMIAGVCEKMNNRAKSLAQIHLHTPAPTELVRFTPRSFDKSPPIPPVPTPHNLKAWFFKSVASAIDIQNRLAQSKYERDLATWNDSKAAFEAAEVDRRDFLEHRIFADPGAMEHHFEQALHDISWPRETHVSFELLDEGKSIVVEVDLPEIEDMPHTSWNLPANSYKPTVKKLSGNRIAEIYSAHVQGIGFRIIGEAFAILPVLNMVTLSAYTQRSSPTNGVMHDDYLYSLRVTRAGWSGINFENLTAVHVSDALGQFELRRNVAKDGRLQAIEPLMKMDRAGIEATSTIETT